MTELVEVEAASELTLEGRAASPWRRPAETRWWSESLTRNGIALAGNTVVTSALGAGFWVLATHLVEPAALGQDAALISVVMVLGILSTLGLSQGMPRLLPQVSRHRGRVVLACYCVTVTVSLVLTGGFIAVVPHLLHGFDFLARERWLWPLLMGCAAASTVLVLQDAVFTGLRLAHFLPVFNGLVGVVKLVLVVVLAGAAVTHGILLAWMLAMILVIPVASGVLVRRLVRSLGATGSPSVSRYLALTDRRRLGGYLAGNYASTVVTLGAALVPPVLVLGVLGRTASAYFYIAFTIATVVVEALAVAIATSLIVEGSHDEARVAGLFRRTLVRCLASLVPAVAVLAAAAPLVLGVFGPAYAAHSTSLLRLLLAGAIPQAVIELYVGIDQVRGRAGRILAVRTLTTSLVLAGVAVPIHGHGLTGVGLGVLAAQSAAALAVVPSIAGVLRDRGRGA